MEVVMTSRTHDVIISIIPVGRFLLAFALVVVALALFSVTAFAQTRDTVLFEGWESGIRNWSVTNGVWEVDTPRTSVNSGPPTARTGRKCAGTVLNGPYPADANTRLKSPWIVLPQIFSGEQLQLRYWEWFNIFGGDRGVVQITLNDTTWQSLSIPVDWNSWAWTHNIVDISAYASLTVRLAFYFTSNGNDQAAGWYIDDISIVKGVFNLPNPEDFELGIGDWYAERGVWEVGTPTAGPPNAHSGQKCAGTILRSTYPALARTRLVSPKIRLIPDAVGRTPVLCFWHWFNIFSIGGDSAIVQISVNGGPWQFISQLFGQNSGAWTQHCIPLTSYVSSTARFAFYFSSNGSDEATGWYVDDIRVDSVMSLPSQVVLVSPANRAIINADSVRFIWNRSSPSVSSYFFERASDSIFINRLIDSSVVDTVKTVRPITNNRFWWRVRAKNQAGLGPASVRRSFDIITDVTEIEHLPTEFRLVQNYPNPFNPTTRIEYAIPKTAHVSLKVFDLLGREVATLVNENLQPGSYETTFDGKDLSSGVYLYRLQAGGFVETKKLLLVR
jgi:hypothetical protein